MYDPDLRIHLRKHMLPFHDTQSRIQIPNCNEHDKQALLEVHQSQHHTGAMQAAGVSNGLHLTAHPESCPHYLSGRSTMAMGQRPGASSPLQFDTGTEGSTLAGRW